MTQTQTITTRRPTLDQPRLLSEEKTLILRTNLSRALHIGEADDGDEDGDFGRSCRRWECRSWPILAIISTKMRWHALIDLSAACFSFFVRPISGRCVTKDRARDCNWTRVRWRRRLVCDWSRSRLICTAGSKKWRSNVSAAGVVIATDNIPKNQ